MAAELGTAALAQRYQLPARAARESIGHVSEARIDGAAC